MKAIVIAIVALVSMAAYSTVSSYSWLGAMFAPTVNFQTYEDGSGIAVDRDGNKIIYCIAGMPCDNSLPSFTLYFPVVEK